MGYFNEALKGISWMGSLRASTRVIAYIKIAILARLLTPSQFGLFGIAFLVLSFLEIITETGINIFLIQEKHGHEKYLDSAWVVSILRGIFIFLLLLILAPLISLFFKSPDARPLLLLISLVPLIRGFINPSIVSLQKNLLFGKEFMLRFWLYSLDTLAAIWAASVTHSAMSLVVGLLVGSVAEVILSHIFFKPKPKIVLDLVKFKKVINRGKWVTLAGIFNYLFQEGDDVAVGRLLNTTSLGLYQMAYKISSLPLSEIGDVVIKVTFPIFVKISGDISNLKAAFYKTITAVTFIVIPFGVALFLFPRELVLMILGSNWLEIVPVVKVLSFFGVARAVISCTYPLFLSLKKQQYITNITLVGILGLGLTIIPLVKTWGILGASISALIGLVATIPVTFYYVNKVFKNIN